MQTIKIKTTDKGEFHWEQYLLEKQERRLKRVLSELDVNPWKKRIVIQLFKSNCTNENIIPLCMHPIKIFLHALIKDELDTLLNNTTLIKTQ